MMCKFWCSVGAGRCCYHVSTFQILPHVIIGCWRMWKNFFGEKNLKQKMVSTLLLLPLYTVRARTITQLQLIIYHVDGEKCVGSANDYIE
jgi:hypothetical protein